MVGQPNRSGRPKKPVEQHKRQGTYDASRHWHDQHTTLEPANRQDVEASPGAIVDKVLHDGVYWLSGTDQPALVMLRETLEERDKLREHVISTDPAEVHPKTRSALRDLDKQVRELLQMLGFDPSSRSRLGLAQVKAESKLESLQRRRNQSD